MPKSTSFRMLRPIPARARTRAIPVLLAFALRLGAAAVAPAQEVSPEVQRLYAAAQAAQAANKPDQAIADYRRILGLAPTLAAAYNNLGRLLYNAGSFPEAVTVLTRGLALNPDMPPARAMLGAAQYQLGQFHEARPLLEAGVAAMPEDRFARITLVRTLLALDQEDAAAAQLQLLLGADPKDQEAWYMLGKLHLRLSQEALSRVQAIDPNSALSHELEGEVMESMRNTPGAVAAYKQAIAAAPGDPDALRHLADVYWSTGDWAAARDRYRTLLAAQPGDCAAHWKLANALDELGDSAEDAMRELNAALSACPQLAQARAERARVALRLGKPADALADLKAAEAAAPDEPSVQQLLAQAYRALGDRAKADAANQRFAALQQAMHQAQERRAASVIEANH